MDMNRRKIGYKNMNQTYSYTYVSVERRIGQRVFQLFSVIFILLNKVNTTTWGLVRLFIVFSVFLKLLKMKRNKQKDSIQSSPLSSDWHAGILAIV